MSILFPSKVSGPYSEETQWLPGGVDRKTQGSLGDDTNTCKKITKVMNMNLGGGGGLVSDNRVGTLETSSQQFHSNFSVINTTQGCAAAA